VTTGVGRPPQGGLHPKGFRGKKKEKGAIKKGGVLKGPGRNKGLKQSPQSQKKRRGSSPPKTTGTSMNKSKVERGWGEKRGRNRSIFHEVGKENLRKKESQRALGPAKRRKGLGGQKITKKGG